MARTRIRRTVHPGPPALAGPWAVIVGTFRAGSTDRVSLAAAGCAFWATTALFPAISALVSVYGLAFDPVSVSAHLDLLVDLLPPPAYELITDRVQHLVSEPHRKLSLDLLIGILLTLWSAATGTKSMLSALNVACEVRETRGMLRFQITGLAMTLLAVAGAMVAISTVVLLPAVVAAIGLPQFSRYLIHGTSLALVLGFFAGAIAVLYRFGPSRNPPPGMRIGPGTVAATVSWLLVSGGLSFYISHLASFGATYGPIGAVVGIMLWFYVSAYTVLMGAELNAQLEMAGSTGNAPQWPSGQTPDGYPDGSTNIGDPH